MKRITSGIKNYEATLHCLKIKGDFRVVACTTVYQADIVFMETMELRDFELDFIHS
jgi:hypothetical protein